MYVQFEDVKYEIYSDIMFHISGNIHRVVLSHSVVSDYL